MSRHGSGIGRGIGGMNAGGAIRVAVAVAAALALASAPAGESAKAEEAQAQSRVLRVEADAPSSAALSLPLGRSVVVDLEREVENVLVADPKVVEAVVRSRRQIYLLGFGAGQTNVFFLDAAGNQILDLETRVDRDLSLLRATLARYLPSASIDVEAMQEHVILSGRVDSAADAASAHDIASRFTGDAEQVLNMMQVRTDEQVLLKVTIAEMEREIMKDLGLDWQVGYTDGRWNLGLAQILPSGPGAGTGFFSGRYPETIGQGNPSVTTYRFGGRNDSGLPPFRGELDVVLKALERDGLIKTLAEPNLTAISGETATFLAGGEFPIPVGRDDDGVVTITFKEYGVGLQFTPLVLDAGRISMQISTEVSELTPAGAVLQQDISIPGIKIRKAETTVELPSGGSLVIAGLLSENTEQNVSGPPGLKDFPVPLLFRNTGFESNETELVIIVTPYLVEASQRSELLLPTDGFVPPDSVEMFFQGRLNHVYGGGRDIKGELQGPGFVLE